MILMEVVMMNAQYIISVVLVISVALLAGCSSGGNANHEQDGVIISGAVREAGGGGISGVLLKVGDSATAYSSQDGTFELTLPKGTTGKILVELRLDGYMTSWRPVFIPASVSHVVATLFMVKSGTPTTIDASEGGAVEEGDATLIIPPGALMDQSGNTVTGPVTVVLTDIDVTGPELLAAPGDLTTSEEEGSDSLESFGMVDINIYININGEEETVEVAPDATLELTIVVDDAQQDPPDESEAKLWWFDTSMGVWRAVGQWSVVVDDDTGAVTYQALVPAVGTWNIDTPFDVGCVEGEVVMNTGGSVSGLEVVAEGITYNSIAYGSTSSDGAYCVEVKPGEQASISAFCPQGSVVSETVEISTAGQCGSGTCVSGPTIIIPCCTKNADCPPAQICVAGLCEGNCDENGCPDGLVCAEDGQCIPAVVDCDDVNPCTNDVLDPDGTCKYWTEDGSPCPEGSCQGGVCVKKASVGDTWFASSSGLTWQVTPTGDKMNWSDAKAHCAGLSLDGGGWHLPTISELRTLIRGCPGTVTGGACGVTDACLDSSCNDAGGCSDCAYDKGPADGCYWPDEMQGTCSWYWSSSPVEDVDNGAWHVGFDYGVVYLDDVNHDVHVRCVR